MNHLLLALESSYTERFLTELQSARQQKATVAENDLAIGKERKCGMAQARFEADCSGYSITDDGHGIISVHSPFYEEWDYKRISAIVERMEEVDEVKDIIIDICSPGGTVNGLFDCASFIAGCKKKITAYVGSECASAAYLIASACDRIVMADTAEMGSCGAQMSVYEYSTKSDAEVKLYTFTFSGSPLKNIRPSTEEGSKLYQQEVDATGNAYITSVAKNRGVTTEEALANFGKGAMLRADECQKRKMCDLTVSGWSDFISQIASLTGGEEGFMDFTKVTNDELEAAVRGKPELLAKLNKEASEKGFSDGQKAGVTAEQERREKISKLGKLGPYAEAIVSDAISSGKSYEDAMGECVAAAQAYVPATPKAGTERDRTASAFISGTPEVNPVQKAENEEAKMNSEIKALVKMREEKNK